MARPRVSVKAPPGSSVRTFRIVLSMLVFALVFGAGPRALRAAPESIRVSLITMGPGDEMVTRFGHDALVVERPGQPGLVYNFGTYNAESRSVARLLSGDLRYFLSVTRYPRTVAHYRRMNRGISLQDLLLDENEATALAQALTENARPANAAYRYDFARDNCATRVRDALDRATGGALRASMTGVAPYTYREHILRLTAPDPFVYAFFDVGLGAPADRKLDAWDDAFLPDRLAGYVAAAKRPGPSGLRPLAGPERVVFRAERPPALERPPQRAHW
ncbi:MAG TPA: DUF4105 domain-containing protein, partial [Polyangiaceae bacterium]